jgi:hypothetical protein
VTCQSCGHEIADNAIVCYRCGAPTALPASARPPAGKPSGRRSRQMLWVFVLIVLLVILLALRFGWHLL